MLFLLYQSKFLMNIDDPLIKESLMRNLKDRTRQRRHNLKKEYWDKVGDKSTISWTPSEGLKNMDAVQWGALLDMWSTTKKQVLVSIHSRLQLFQFYKSGLMLMCSYFVCVDRLYESQFSRQKILYPGLTGCRSYELSSDGSLNALELFKNLQKGKTRDTLHR